MLTEDELKGIAMAAIVDKYDKLLYQERIKAKKLLSFISQNLESWQNQASTPDFICSEIDDIKKQISEYNKTQP